MGLGRPLAVLTVIAAVLTGCGEEETGVRDLTDPPPARVVVTTADGQVVEFTDFSVTCRPSDDDQPPAQIVTALSGYGDAEQPTKPDGPAMIIEAADSTSGTTVELPYDEGYGDEQTYITVFITEAGDERELASHTERSTGEIEVVSATREPTPELEVRIDGEIASEFSDDGTVTIDGYVRVECLLASGEGDGAVGMSGELVVVVVGQGVMSGAEPDGVLDRRAASFGPGGEVVGVTLRGGVFAAAGGAGLGTHEHRDPLGFGVEALLPADVEGLGVTVEDDRDDPRLTRELPRLAGADRGAGVELGRFQPTQEGSRVIITTTVADTPPACGSRSAG